MAKNHLTQEDLNTLDHLLHDRDDRTAFYLHYYELTGNREVLDMAKISHFTDWVGGVAEKANETVEAKYPDLYPKGEINPAEYPTGGVKEFSEHVAENLFQAVKNDFASDKENPGVLNDHQVLEVARAAWDSHNLGEQFPGNPLLAAERLWAADLTGAKDAIASEGTKVAFESAVESTFDKAFQGDADFKARIENDSYNVTEDGRAGFYVDKDTGRIEGVVDHHTFGIPTDHHSDHIPGKAEWAIGIDPNPGPPVEAQGVPNALPPMEQPPAETPVSPIQPIETPAQPNGSSSITPSTDPTVQAPLPDAFAAAAGTPNVEGQTPPNTIQPAVQSLLPDPFTAAASTDAALQTTALEPVTPTTLGTIAQPDQSIVVPDAFAIAAQPSTDPNYNAPLPDISYQPPASKDMFSPALPETSWPATTHQEPPHEQYSAPPPEAQNQSSWVNDLSGGKSSSEPTEHGRHSSWVDHVAETHQEQNHTSWTDHVSHETGSNVSHETGSSHSHETHDPGSSNHSHESGHTGSHGSHDTSGPGHDSGIGI